MKTTVLKARSNGKTLAVKATQTEFEALFEKRHQELRKQFNDEWEKKRLYGIDPEPKKTNQIRYRGSWMKEYRQKLRNEFEQEQGIPAWNLGLDEQDGRFEIVYVRWLEERLLRSKISQNIDNRLIESMKVDLQELKTMKPQTIPDISNHFVLPIDTVLIAYSELQDYIEAIYSESRVSPVVFVNVASTTFDSVKDICRGRKIETTELHEHLFVIHHSLGITIFYRN